MAFLTVDEKRCRGCGACVAVCPLRIISLDGKTRRPFAVAEREGLCINCGHCVAVCPHAALSLTSMPVSACEELAPDWKIPPEKLIPFLKARRSIRAYQDRPVEAETVERLIDAARYAPSGINRQPVSWAAIGERGALRRLTEATVGWMRALLAAGSPLAGSLRFDGIVRGWESGCDPVLRGAPQLIIACGLADDPTAPQAGTIALTYLELAAVSCGLGACWAGYIHMAINSDDAVRQAAGISRRLVCLGALMLGYPAFSYHRIPLRNAPRLRKRIAT